MFNFKKRREKAIERKIDEDTCEGIDEKGRAYTSHRNPPTKKPRQQKKRHFVNEPIKPIEWNCKKLGHDYEVIEVRKLIYTETRKISGVNLFMECRECKERRSCYCGNGCCVTSLFSLWENGIISMDKAKELEILIGKKYIEFKKEEEQKAMKPKSTKSKTKKEVK